MLKEQQHQSCIIIGGGFGGLLCGAILAKNGYHITVLDQNKQMGGCLQSFGFQKELFDSCVHYIGGLDEGATQRKIFDYLDIDIASIGLSRLNDAAFDAIQINGSQYLLPQGYPAFRAQLVAYFPEEITAINQYISTIQTICADVSLYQLSLEHQERKSRWFGITLQSFLSSIGLSSTLQQVLVGNALLYAGNNTTTALLTHALIMNAYIQGSYTFKHGSALLTKALTKIIHDHGGQCLTNQKVTQIHCAGNAVTHVTTANQHTFSAPQYICNIAPDRMLDLLENDNLRNVYKKRIRTAQQTCSALMINAILQPKTVLYKGTNDYYVGTDALAISNHQWGDYYAIYYKEDKQHPGYASSIAILTYDDYTRYAEWHTDVNTQAHKSKRHTEYNTYKAVKAKKLLAKVEQDYPELKDQITAFQVATPLTYSDYMGTYNGSIYGIEKDATQPMHNQLATPTKLDNLYLTGQNINLHGILGVSLTALQTCGHLIDLETLLTKINNPTSLK